MSFGVDDNLEFLGSFMHGLAQRGKDVLREIIFQIIAFVAFVFADVTEFVLFADVRIFQRRHFKPCQAVVIIRLIFAHRKTQREVVVFHFIPTSHFAHDHSFGHSYRIADNRVRKTGAGKPEVCVGQFLIFFDIRVDFRPHVFDRISFVADAAVRIPVLDFNPAGITACPQIVFDVAELV